MADHDPTRRRAHTIPGTVKPARFRPRFHWELLACGTRGHELVGLDAAELRAEDRVFAFESTLEALAYVEEGQWDKARSSLQRAFQLKQDFDGATAARRALETIGAAAP